MANRRYNMKCATLIGLVTGLLGAFSCGDSIQLEMKKCRSNYYDYNSTDTRCYRLQTELIEQAGNGNLEAVKRAIAEGANVNAVVDPYPLPLTAAARGGNDMVVSYLLEQGAKIDGKAAALVGTALWEATNSNHPTTVKLLISKGANICLRADEDRPLDVARRKGFQDIVDLLIAAGAEKCSD
jgi:ankyrin repeat protein